MEIVSSAPGRVSASGLFCARRCKRRVGNCWHAGMLRSRRGGAARGYAGTLACCEAEASSKGRPETGIDASDIISPANYPVSGFPLS